MNRPDTFWEWAKGDFLGIMFFSVVCVLVVVGALVASLCGWRMLFKVLVYSL